MNVTPLVNRILFPTDGSELANRAAGYAAEIAKCTGAEVSVLHAMETTLLTEFVSYSVGSRAGVKERLHETGTDVIDKTRRIFLESAIPTHTKIVEGPAAEVILREASDGHYDMIVMGSRGAGASMIRRVVFGLGSVAERVVANAPCPVLVVRGDG